MPFKVVQTLEDDNIFITFCPDQWVRESDGKLLWPQSLLEGEKLKKKEDSQPQNDWQVLDCEVKRRHLTLAQAKAAAKAMSDLSETEEDDAESKAKKRKFCKETNTICLNNLAGERLASQTKKKPTSKENLVTLSTNTVPLKSNSALKTLSEARHTGLLQDTQTTSCIPSQRQVTTDENTPAASTSSETQSALRENMESYVVIPDSNQTDTPILYSYVNKGLSSSEENYQLNNDLKSIEKDINIIKRDIQSINDDNKTIMEILNTILNNQAIIHNAVEPIERKVTELQVVNEEFIAKSITEKRNHALGLQPIKDTKDLEEFENKLLDSNYREDLQRQLSVMCTKGLGKGTTSAYALVDVLFERQFFKSCSWTGVSRTSNEATEKICFKGFSKTISFFFDIIHQHDSSFHLNDCHKFFKTILRNADQRCKTKPQRVSTKKCRGKKSDKKTRSENEKKDADEKEKDECRGKETDKKTCSDNEKKDEDVSDEELDLR